MPLKVLEEEFEIWQREKVGDDHKWHARRWGFGAFEPPWRCVLTLSCWFHSNIMFQDDWRSWLDCETG